MEFKRASVSVMRNCCRDSHRSVSVMKINSSDSTILYQYLPINCPQEESLSVIYLDTTVPKPYSLVSLIIGFPNFDRNSFQNLKFCEPSRPLQHSKMSRNPNLSKICWIVFQDSNQGGPNLSKICRILENGHFRTNFRFSTNF